MVTPTASVPIYTQEYFDRIRRLVEENVLLHQRISELEAQLGADQPILVSAVPTAAAGIVLDLDACTAQYGEGPVMPLTGKQFRVLRTLVANAGRVVSLERLVETVWGYDGEGDVRNLRHHIKVIRERLRLPVWGTGAIVSRPEVGYLLSVSGQERGPIWRSKVS